MEPYTSDEIMSLSTENQTLPEQRSMSGEAVLSYLGPKTETRRNLHAFYTEFRNAFFPEDPGIEPDEERKRTFARLYYLLLNLSGRASLAALEDFREFVERYVEGIDDGRRLWGVGDFEDEARIEDLACELWGAPGKPVPAECLQNFPVASSLEPRERTKVLSFSRFMK